MHGFGRVPFPISSFQVFYECPLTKIQNSTRKVPLLYTNINFGAPLAIKGVKMAFQQKALPYGEFKMSKSLSRVYILS